MRPMIIVIRQNNHYFGTLDDGSGVGFSDSNLALFATQLSAQVGASLSWGKEGAQIEILFMEGEENVRFVVRKKQGQELNVDMVSEIPLQGNMLAFLDCFTQR